MGAGENDGQISQNYIFQMKFQKFAFVFTILGKFLGIDKAQEPFLFLITGETRPVLLQQIAG